MTCETCGTPLVPGARFCFHCGAPQTPSVSSEDAERRIVTVLFGDLTEFTSWAEDLDPERVSIVTDRLLAALTGSVTEVGGHVDKLTGDGVMAVFGAPTSHEDDVERAVLAAASMQQEVTRLVNEETGGGGRRLGLRVGLNTGEVLAGVQAHVSYTVVGDTVNTASRLSDAASPGGVYAGRETAAATMHMASWRALQPLRLKGKREPVEAYELLGLRTGTTNRLGLGDEAPTIGREAELGALVGEFLAVTDRASPQSVLVAGDAGVGKTRLGRELARFADQIPDARVLWTQCVPFGLSRDLAPLAQLVRAACGIVDGDGPDESRERVRTTVAHLDPPQHAPWAPQVLTEQLFGVLGLAPERATGQVDGVTPGIRVERPDVDGLVSLLSSIAAEGPLVIVVDDVHVARDGLRSALADIVTGLVGPVLFVALGREVETRQEPLAYDVVLPVGPLEPPAAERLLRSYLGGGELGPHDRAEILDRAEGNPFFLAEILHLLVDRGFLVHGDGGWSLHQEIPADLLPAGVQAVLTARIDSLDPVARSLLRDAAVLGASFPSSALAAIDPRVEASQVPAAMQSLVGRGLLVATGRGQYAFAHTLAREVAYAGLPKGERARRHAGAARWAGESTALGNEADAVTAVQADRAVRLAQEMSLPQDDPSWGAAPLGLAAATRLGIAALARDDNMSAETHLTRALRLAEATTAGDVPAAVLDPVTVAYAESLAGQRKLAEAESALTGPLASDVDEVRADALLVLGDIRHKQADDRAARTAFVQAFALAGEHGFDRQAGVAIRELGLLDMLEGRLRDAENRFREALELAERVGDERGMGWALQNLAWSATTRADYDVVEGALRRASEVFVGLQDTGGLAWCAGTEALVRMFQGRHSDARRLVAGLLPVSEQLGADWETAACRTIDAIAAAELGQLEVARQQGELATAGFEELGDPWGVVMAAIAEAIVARAYGETREARTALRRAIAVGSTSSHRTLELMATVLIGLLHLDRGDTRAASNAVDRAGEIAATLDLNDSATSAQLVLRAQVLRGRGRLAEARELLTTAAAADLPTLLFPRRQALAHLAGVALQMDDVAGARQTIMRALSVPAEDVRSQVVTQRVLADVLAADGDLEGSRAAAADALRLVEESGFDGELPATRRLVSRVGLSART